MYQRLFLCTILGCLAAICNAQEKRFSFTREKMGSPFSIMFYDLDSFHATKVAVESFGLVDSLVNIFSDYIDSSELNKLGASSGTGRFVPVSPALYEIMHRSQNAFQLSDGAFDITIGPLSRLWRKARRERHFPDYTAINEKKKVVGFDKLQVDTAKKAARLLLPGMQLDLGGIAQGYIAQKVLERLALRSITSALVNASGDIAVSAGPPGKKGWTIGVNLPEQEDNLQKQKLLLQYCAVSTSGDVYQYLQHNGKKYSHIIDPRTGYGVTYRRNVTVIAKNAATADWLATACSILPLKKAKTLALKLNAQVIIARVKGTRLIFHRTRKFKNYFVNE